MAGTRLRALNRTRNTILTTQGEVATGWWSRARGLLGHAPLQEGQGLLLRGDKAIHMIGMTFALDIVFLDRAGRVVHLIPEIKPLRLSPIVFNASDVIELPTGTIARTHTAMGDQIELELI